MSPTDGSSHGALRGWGMAHVNLGENIYDSLQPECLMQVPMLSEPEAVGNMVDDSVSGSGIGSVASFLQFETVTTAYRRYASVLLAYCAFPNHVYRCMKLDP